MYVIRIEAKNLAQSERLLLSLDRMLTSKRDEMATRSLTSAAKVWQRNFQTEGGEVGGWRQLADRTIEERERLGFGGAHPIMIRYSQLRTLTTDNLTRMRTHHGAWSQSDPQGGTIRVSVSSRNGRMEVVAAGSKAMNQERGRKRPARPYWFVNSHIKRNVRDGVVHFLRDELRRIRVI